MYSRRCQLVIAVGGGSSSIIDRFYNLLRNVIPISLRNRLGFTWI